MLKHFKNPTLERLVNFLLYLFPISFIMGNSVVHLNIYLFLIFSLFYIARKNYKLNFSHSNKILTLFFLLIIISSSLNHFVSEWITTTSRNAWDDSIDMITHGYFVNSILLLRFLILYFVMETLLVKNKLDLNKFFIACFLSVTLVSVDVIFQYIFGFDLLGYEINSGGITGVFESEAIAGSYIQKFSMLGLFGSLFFFKSKKNKLSLIIVILLFLFGTFFASNRISFILLLFSLLILFLIFKKMRLVIIASIIVFSCLSAILIINDDVLKNQYHHLYYRFITDQDKSKKNNISNQKTKSEIEEKKITFNKSAYLRIYLTALNSWINNPILGWGHKSFRVNCRDLIKEKSKLLGSFKPVCSSHPHNYQIEILHNTGIIGFLLILSFAFILLFKMWKVLIINKQKNEKKFIYLVPISIAVFVEMWPLKSTGSLFSTWNGSLFWLIFSLSSLLNVNLNQIKIKKDIKNNNDFIFKFFIILSSSLILKKFIFDI